MEPCTSFGLSSNSGWNLTIDLDKSENVVHPLWEIYDPTPDLQSLFTQYNALYFDNILGPICVEWSKRMKRCAGVFYALHNDKLIIRLSEPILKFQSRKDIVDTLLHEMIHAFLFVIGENENHGEKFIEKMDEINRKAQTNISIQHRFFDPDEVFIWRCNGSCQKKPPLFGLFHRKHIPTAPNDKDDFWIQHQKECKGTFQRIIENDAKLSNWDFITRVTSNVENLKIKSTQIGLLQTVSGIRASDQKHNTENGKDNTIKNNNDLEAIGKSVLAADVSTAATNMWQASFNQTLQQEHDERITQIKEEIAHEIGTNINDIELIDTDFDNVAIADENFGNYDATEKRLLNVDYLSIELDPKVDSIVCIVCEKCVPEDNMFAHIEECTGLVVFLPLPFYKIPNRR